MSTLKPEAVDLSLRLLIKKAAPFSMNIEFIDNNRRAIFTQNNQSVEISGYTMRRTSSKRVIEIAKNKLMNKEFETFALQSGLTLK